MDLSRGDNVDPPAAPAQVDGRASAEPSELAEGESSESSEPPGSGLAAAELAGAELAGAEPLAEFWDACWTLEDECVPRAIVGPEQYPHLRKNHLPDLIVLL